MRASSNLHLCIRCNALAATQHDWLHCDPCFQAVCNEVHAAECELSGMGTACDGVTDDTDAIGRLMLEEGIGFIEAVERLAGERGR